MIRRACVLLFCLVVLVPAVCAQSFEFYPGAKYDPAIPTLKQVVGHGWGEGITMHHEMERYLQALEKASPRIRVVQQGETWTGKALYYVIVASEANMARLDEVKAGMQKLADPRTTNAAEAAQLIQALPAVTWLAYGVHGGEISSPDAGLLLAYHLVAVQNDDVAREILERTIVIIDPMQNPDGRDRFIQYFRDTRGPEPDPDPSAAEHNAGWPGGRFNHYLFDMNRDWFALTQLETRARVKSYLEWRPLVYVDLHEMGGNSTYYFAPPSAPINPNVPASHAEWWNVFGKNNAAWFDRFKFDYFTREVFDSFYPGYGEGWPLFQGSIGMTYEQASTSGLVYRRNDGTKLHYRDAVQHHFISSIATAQTAARNREALLQHFYDYRRTGIEEGQKETVKEYILPPGRDGNRVLKLAAILRAQGIEVKRAEDAFTNSRVRDYAEGKLQSKEFPAGTIVVSAAQPGKRLLKTLMDKNTPMDDAFLKEQVRRQSQRRDTQFYDVTGWSLPLLYGVECYLAEQASTGKISVLNEAPVPAGKLHGGPAKLVYVIPWGSNSAARALVDLFRHGIRVHTADKAFTLNGVKFRSGSLIVKVRDNPEDLHEHIARISAQYGVDAYSSDSSWVDDGINLGSGKVVYAEPPRVALAWNMPTSPLSAGWTRYVLERAYGMQVTVINTMQLPGTDLSKYNVLILPDSFRFLGGYAGVLGEGGARRIRDWVQQGGTLITFGAATLWLTDEKVGLLSTQRELRGGKPDVPKKEEKPAAKPGEEKKAETAALPTDFNVEQFIQPERELPDSTPGALFRVKLDTEEWLAAGYDGEAYVIVDGENIFQPLKLDKGRNIALFYPSTENLASGFTWEASQKQLGNKAYLMYQPTGRGHVVAFSDDPNYRAFMDGLNLLFLNGVLFGPGH